MSLFTSNHSRDFETGCRVFSLAITRFNELPGEAYSTKISLDEGELAKACEAFAGIVEAGFPDNPGPFKRLAGIAVLMQHFRIIQVSTSEIDNERGRQIVWAPRLALWTVEFTAPLLKLESGQPVGSFHLPTPHYQVEFIAVLRNFCQGSYGLVSQSIGLLLERCSTIALALESSAYCGKDKHPCADGGADDCVKEIIKDPEMRSDLKFNDPVCLELATDCSWSN